MVYATKKSNMVSIHVKLNKGIVLWVNTGRAKRGSLPQGLDSKPAVGRLQKLVIIIIIKIIKPLLCPI